MLKRLLALLIAALCLIGAGCFTSPESGNETVVIAPTDPMTQVPTHSPTEAASAAPTAEPSPTPIPTPFTAAPTDAPTDAPSAPPSDTPKPTNTPKPTAAPSETIVPSDTPAPTKTPKPTASPTATPKPAGTQKPAQIPEVGEIDPSDPVMMFVGDLMCLSGQQYAAMNQAGSSSNYDFMPSFEYVRELISGADCAFANLETTLSDSWPYAAQQNMTDGMPNCNGPAEYLAAVRRAGFDALAMANNHCCDAGLQGIYDTVSAVREYGFKHTGVFISESEERFVIINVKGIKVALLSYAEFYNGKQGCVTDAGLSYMLNTYSEAAARRDIAAAKSAGAEFIVVYEHWGREHTHTPTDVQRRHALQLANAGADLICGSHSHTVQPSVWIDAEDGRQVLCLYSMGNFVSSMSQTAANDTFVLEVHIHRNGDGSVVIKNEVYHPCRVIRAISGKAFIVVPTSCTSVSSSIRAQLEAAEARIVSVLFSER